MPFVCIPIRNIGGGPCVFMSAALSLDHSDIAGGTEWIVDRAVLASGEATRITVSATTPAAREQLDQRIYDGKDMDVFVMYADLSGNGVGEARYRVRSGGRTGWEVRSASQFILPVALREVTRHPVR